MQSTFQLVEFNKIIVLTLFIVIRDYNIFFFTIKKQKDRFITKIRYWNSYRGLKFNLNSNFRNVNEKY